MPEEIARKFLYGGVDYQGVGRKPLHIWYMLPDDWQNDGTVAPLDNAKYFAKTIYPCGVGGIIQTKIEAREDGWIIVLNKDTSYAGFLKNDFQVTELMARHRADKTQIDLAQMGNKDKNNPLDEQVLLPFRLAYQNLRTYSQKAAYIAWIISFITGK